MSDSHTIVTGAGRGLGRGAAIALAGMAVTLVARTRSELDEKAAAIADSGGSARLHVADVTDELQVVEMIGAAEGRDLRVCVNAARGNRSGPSRGYAVAEWANGARAGRAARCVWRGWRP